MKKLIKIVIPMYSEASNIIKLYDNLEQITCKFPEYIWEYIFVNDGSRDQTFNILHALSITDYKVKVIDLSRNFGKEIALTAGVHHALNADAVICMDADLQHPPELISDLLMEWKNGAEIVATIRVSTAKQKIFRKICSHLYYWIMSKISGLDMISQTTDFRLYDRKVISAFYKMTERSRMFRAIMDWMGFKKVYIEFKADERDNGISKYSFSKLYTLAINSITSFSLLPLRITGYLGILITSVSGLLLFWMIFDLLFANPKSFSPIALVVIANTFLIGIVLISIGLIALYIGNIHTEVINRPLYIIRERLNIEEN